MSKVNIVLIGLGILIIGSLGWWVKEKNNQQVPDTHFSIVISPWKEEAEPFLNKLENKINVGNKYKLCDQVEYGSLSGSGVMVVVSGPAKIKTTACIESVLIENGNNIREIILSGIGGISPNKGAEQVMLGDVCIGSAVIDFDRQNYSADSKNTPNPDPLFWSIKDSNNLYRKTNGDVILANELYAATDKVNWPTVPPIIEQMNQLYHQNSRAPKAWGPAQCLEVTGDLWWHDSRLDQLAKTMAAEWLNETQKQKLSTQNVLILTAMETFPVAQLVNWWNEAYGTKIAFAYSRGASNFDQVWKNSNNTSGEDGKTSREISMHNENVRLAVTTAALPILKMFELRK